MSERKTAEIKFRIAPSEKARWQADAEAEGIGLSELIRRRMNFAHDLKLQQGSLDSTSLVDNAIAQLKQDGLGESGLAAQLDLTKVERKSWMFEYPESAEEALGG